VVLSGISPSFDGLSRTPRQVIHVLLTRAPVYSPSCPDFLPRLACLRHAASVRSEPGSNSPCKLILSSRVDAATASNEMDRPQLYKKPKKPDGLGPTFDPRRPIKGMHYYSVFKDRRPQGQTETISLGPSAVNPDSFMLRIYYEQRRRANASKYTAAHTDTRPAIRNIGA
jgi:hypothetical protein